MNSKDKLDAKEIEDDQSRLQSRKKRLFFVNEQKSLLRRNVKRHRFSSSFFSFNENIKTKNEFDVSNYTFVKRYRRLKSYVVSNDLINMRVNINDSIDTKLDEHTRQSSFCHTIVVYEQQQ